MTTGAGNDIEQATELARKMVCQFGMSSLGPMTFGKQEEQIFLGREIAQHRDYSEHTAVAIDEEVRKFVMQRLRPREDDPDGKSRGADPDCRSAARTRIARCRRNQAADCGQPLEERRPRRSNRRRKSRLRRRQRVRPARFRRTERPAPA